MTVDEDLVWEKDSFEAATASAEILKDSHTQHFIRGQFRDILELSPRHGTLESSGDTGICSSWGYWERPMDNSLNGQVIDGRNGNFWWTGSGGIVTCQCKSLTTYSNRWRKIHRACKTQIMWYIEIITCLECSCCLWVQDRKRKVFIFWCLLQGLDIKRFSCGI